MKFLDIFFPPRCFGCQIYHSAYLCRRCRETIVINQTFFCPVCQNRLPENRRICHFDAPYILAAAADYHNELVQTLIHQLKYQSLTCALGPIASLLEDYLSALQRNGSYHLHRFIVIPVPLSSYRLRQRGFNQAGLIARRVAEKLQLPLVAEALTRIKDTPKQSEAKTREERQQNVVGCFAVTDVRAIERKNVLLVDDVFTSGATVGEAARTLKAAGARRIIALTAARA